ncbi:uncharacterized protein LOC144819669 [Lissotriton helveticus]
MAGRRNPRFTDRELSVMVDEIIRVEPRLFGAQVHNTTIAEKRQMWARIVGRVNAVASNLRTHEEIRKRWNDLRRRVCSLASKRHLEAQRTGGGSPRPPLQLFPWEEKVLQIQHFEDLTGIPGGVETGPTPRVRGQPSATATDDTSTPDQEQAFSEESTSACQDDEEQAVPSGSPGQTAPVSLPLPTPTSPTPAVTTPQPLDISNSYVQRNITPFLCPPVLAAADPTPPPPPVQQGPSEMGHIGSRAQGTGGRVHGRESVGQQSEATGFIVTQNTIDQVLNSLNQFQDRMGQVLTELREMKQLQREHNVQMETFNSSLGSLTGVIHDCFTHMCRAFPATSSPVCGPTTYGPTTSATERDALPQEETSVSTSVPATVNPPIPTTVNPPVSLRRERSSGPAGEDRKTSTINTTKRRRT